MNVTLNLFYLILYLVCYLAMTFIAFHFIRKSSKERGERERADLQLVNLYKDKMHAEGKCKRLLKDYNELQEQYAELEAARDHYKEHAICANERAMVLKAELEKCKNKGDSSGEKVWERVLGIMRCEHDEDVREIERLNRELDELEAKCDRLEAELEQSRKPASEEKVADVCKEFCEKLDEAVGELELDIDKLVDECIKELMEGVE